jgi:hypothetical protein
VNQLLRYLCDHEESLRFHVHAVRASKSPTL